MQPHTRQTRKSRNASSTHYTGLTRLTPVAHPHLTRQGGRSPRSYKQSSEFDETHREESGISESSRPYENIYEPARISTKLNYTEQRANPDHPHLTRQGGRTQNSYNEEETNTQLNKEHFKESTFTPAYNTKHAAQESSGSLNSHNY